MKLKNAVLTLTILILTWGTCSAQSTLQVNIKDCRNQSRFHFLGEVKLFRNDSLIRTIVPKLKNEHTVKNLEYGIYRIDYLTIFRKTESVNIELSERKKYRVDLCLDYLDYDLESYSPIVDQLKNGESYSIKVYSQGCFHRSNEQIVVARLKDKYYVNYQGVERLLKKDEIQLIRRFELELNHMESVGCTTTDVYTLKYKEKEISIADGSCSWYGLSHLKNKLKLVRE